MGLVDTLQSHARHQPHKTALVCGPEEISYQQLWQSVVDASIALKTAGVQPGDRVAWLGLNDPAMLVLLYALARIGAILLPLNYRLAEAELLTILAHAGVTRIVADSAHLPAARSLAVQGDALALMTVQDLLLQPEEILSSVRVELVETLRQAQGERFLHHGVGSITSAVPPGFNQIDADADADADIPVLLVYTSGTTGQPKGALHTQAGLVANCLISAHAHDFSPQDHVLTVLPMFHVGGLCIQTLPALHAGAQVTLHARFEPLAWLQDVQRLRPTMSLLVPATLRAVIERSEFASTKLSSLKLLNAGSSTIPGSYIAAFHQRGVPVCQVYGATETGPVSIYLKKEDAMAHPGSAGRAGAGVQVRIVKPGGDGAHSGHAETDVAQDADVGELWIRAPNLMAGYWKDPHNPSFLDGWFRSGDLARVDDDGFYWVVGRSKDMIISGGENIYPAEIENILADCPLIAESAVVGMPDERWGEVAVAVVVLAAGATLTQAEVLALFDGQLARFKHPRRVIFEAALPKSALGKVLKQVIKNKLQ